MGLQKLTVSPAPDFSEPNSPKSWSELKSKQLPSTNCLTWLKRLQFTLIFVVCAAVLTIQVVRCLERFDRRETGTADKYLHTSLTSFPSMTICSSTPYDLQALQNLGVDTKSALQWDAMWVANDSSISPQEFYDIVTPSLKEVIRGVAFFTERRVHNTTVHKFDADQFVCNQSLFSVLPYYYFGDCFVLRAPQCMHQAGILELILQFEGKTDVFIHHNNQFMSPNSRSRVDVMKGDFIKIAINHEVVELLNNSGICVNEEINNGFDNCMFDQLHKVMMEEVNCTVPWMNDKSNICVNDKDRKRAFEVYQEHRRNQHDLCKPSCTSTNMYFGPPVTGAMELATDTQAIFYFRRDVKVTSEYFLYSELSLVAEIGGYVGLLMGFSVFKLAEFFNLLLDKAIYEAEIHEKSVIKISTGNEDARRKIGQGKKGQSGTVFVGRGNHRRLRSDNSKSAINDGQINSGYF